MAYGIKKTFFCKLNSRNIDIQTKILLSTLKQFIFVCKLYVQELLRPCQKELSLNGCLLNKVNDMLAPISGKFANSDVNNDKDTYV